MAGNDGECGPRGYLAAEAVSRADEEPARFLQTDLPRKPA